MKYGLQEKTMEAICGVFARFPQIESAVLYGSRAKGNFRNGSDIDITLKGEGLDLSALAKIETALDDLSLPYKIDVSVFHKLDNDAFVEHINRVGVVVYEKARQKMCGIK